MNECQIGKTQCEDSLWKGPPDYQDLKSCCPTLYFFCSYQAIVMECFFYFWIKPPFQHINVKFLMFSKYGSEARGVCMCVYTLAGSGSGGVGSSKYCSHQTGRSVCRGPLECSWLRPRLPYPSCPSEHRQAYVMMSGWAFAICFCTDLQEGLVTGHSTELEVTKGSL